eukprot:TRINITY_DN103473_c0_g1_i1.p1 TRINITY_DN103473_c0_g1~~TRINITY_DN103473_c0_g1_i1.p1  ORF type:complete len:278 (-),score=60.83 TRINITY_DN103473_c0_g1_i1:97-930(-)
MASLRVFDASWQDLYNLIALPTAPVLLRASAKGPIFPCYVDVPDAGTAAVAALLNGLEADGIFDPSSPLVVYGELDEDVDALVSTLLQEEVADEVLCLSAVHRCSAEAARRFVEKFPWLLAEVVPRSALPSCIRVLSERLYLGDRCSAAASTLDALSFKYVVNCTPEIDCSSLERARYLRIAVDDDASASLLDELDAACDFIAEGLGSGENVLVHCWAGVSRSASIVLAYAIRDLGLSFQDALEAVRSDRWCVCPNPGFVLQLQSWEAKVRAAASTQ